MASSGLNPLVAGKRRSPASVMTIILFAWLSKKTKVVQRLIKGSPVLPYKTWNP